MVHKGERPTVREIGALIGLRSPATVMKHLQALEREGLLRLSGKSRGIRVCTPLPAATPFGVGDTPLAGSNPARSGNSLGAVDPTFGAVEDVEVRPTDRGRETFGIPVVGKIAAGRPIAAVAEEEAADVPATFTGSSPTLFSSEHQPSSRNPRDGSFPEISIDPGLFAGSGDLMALRVTGESMIGAGILDGDLVIIRRQTAVDDGEIAAVEVDGEVTLKRWNGPAVLDGSVRLIPANPALRPIEIAAADGKDVRVLGKYVGLVRGARL